MTPPVRVELVFATPTRVARDHVEGPPGMTIGEAIRRSALASMLDDAAGPGLQVGVFSRLGSLSDVARDGDRIELYRPLVADPKSARRRRAAGQRLKGGARPGSG